MQSHENFKPNGNGVSLRLSHVCKSFLIKLKNSSALFSPLNLGKHFPIVYNMGTVFLINTSQLRTSNILDLYQGLCPMIQDCLSLRKMRENGQWVGAKFISILMTLPRNHGQKKWVSCFMGNCWQT